MAKHSEVTRTFIGQILHEQSENFNGRDLWTSTKNIVFQKRDAKADAALQSQAACV